jgi:hypothetical protein
MKLCYSTGIKYESLDDENAADEMAASKAKEKPLYSSRKNYIRRTKQASGQHLSRVDSAGETSMTYVAALCLLLAVLDRVELVDTRTEVLWVSPERDLQILEELVHAGKERLRRRGIGLDGRLAGEDDDSVREVRGEQEIVLNDERRLARVHDEAADDARRRVSRLGLSFSTKKRCRLRRTA